MSDTPHVLALMAGGLRHDSLSCAGHPQVKTPNILDACRAKGMLDDTLVVFLSGHGEMLGDHGRVSASTFYESSMRVPLIVSWPKRFASGVATDALAEIMDVFPTLLDAPGLDASLRAQGASLVPILEGATHLSPSSQLSEVSNAGERRFCIRTRSHKYAVRADSVGYLLYDLVKDPLEQDNLIGRDYAQEARMRDLLFTRLVEGQWER